MKKLLILFAALTIAGCQGQTIMTNVQQEPLYIDKSNHMVAVIRNGQYHYILFDVTTQSYIYREVPYYHYPNIERLPRSKHVFAQ